MSFFSLCFLFIYDFLSIFPSTFFLYICIYIFSCTKVDWKVHRLTKRDRYDVIIWTFQPKKCSAPTTLDVSILISFTLSIYLYFGPFFLHFSFFYFSLFVRLFRLLVSIFNFHFSFFPFYSFSCFYSFILHFPTLFGLKMNQFFFLLFSFFNSFTVFVLFSTFPFYLTNHHTTEFAIS